MGDNNINQINGGITGFVSQLNQYFQSMIQNVYPRSTSGVVVNEAGSLGDSTRRWSGLYSKNGNFTGPLNLEGTLLMPKRVDTIITDLGAGSLVLPDDVAHVIIQLYGGGGSGGCQVYDRNFPCYVHGGGGSGFAQLELELAAVGMTIDFNVGAGAVGVSTSSLVKGNNGSDTTLTIGGIEVARAFGGRAGGASNTLENVGGAAGSIDQKIRSYLQTSEYAITNFSQADGGATASPSSPAGYSNPGTGASFNQNFGYGGGASILASGGNATANSSRTNGGGGAGYANGGNAGSTTSGAGGNGGIVITYFKGVRA